MFKFKFKSIACMLLISGAGTVCANVVSYNNLDFSSTGQSMWSPGSAQGLNIDRFIGTTWNTSPHLGGFTGGIETVTASYPHPHLPSGWECHGVLCSSGHFHNPGSIHTHTKNLGTIDTTTGARVDVSTSGKVGFQFGLHADSGSVNTDVKFDANLFVPDAFAITTKQFFNLNPNSSLVGGQLSTNFPELSASLDAIVGVRASATGKACAALLGCKTASTGELGFPDQTIPLVSFNDGGNGQIKVLGALDPTLFQFDSEISIPGPSGGSLGGVTVHVPDADALGGVVGDKLLASGSDDLIKLTADLDGLALAPLGLPGGGVSFDAGILSVSADLIDIDMGPILKIVQNFEFKPTLFVDLVFDNPVLIAGMIGPQTAWSGLWSALPDIAAMTGGNTRVTPTFSIQGLFKNETLLGIDGIFQLDILKAAFALEAFGLSFDLGELGPLFQILQRTNLFNTPPLFSNTFALNGFQSITGDAFIITASVPEPGTIVLMLAGLILLNLRLKLRYKGACRQ